MRKDVSKSSIVAIQEVHGTPEKVSRMLFPLRKDFLIVHSFTPNADDNPGYKEDQGSVITLVPMVPNISANMFEKMEVVPGRVLRVSVVLGSYHWYHWNIHNHGLTQDQVNQVTDLIDADASSVRANPKEYFLIVCGDFNFLPPGEYHKSVSRPNSTTRDRHDPPVARPNQPRWQNSLEKMTDIQQPFETHYHSASATLSRLDRLYVASPPGSYCSWGYAENFSMTPFNPINNLLATTFRQLFASRISTNFQQSRGQFRAL